MSLPRYALPEDDDFLEELFFEEEEGDSTAPAQFLLKLPRSYSRRLASIAPAHTPYEFTLPAPVIAPSTVATPKTQAPPFRLIAMIAGAAVAIAIVAGVGGALAQSSGGPVGIAKRAPKKIEHVIRTPTRQSGVAAVARVHAPVVTTHATPRPRAKRKH